MTDYAGEIAGTVGSAPADLVAFYARGALPDYPASRIRCLPFGQAQAYTRDMQGIAVAARLGLWILDDADDSNPYAYVTRGPCAGVVMHFSHDGQARLAHASLADFVAALEAAGAAGVDIDDIAAAELRLPLDKELEVLARGQGEGGEEAVFLLCAYLGASAPLQAGAQAMLLRHEDFFVREALAVHLARALRAQDLADVELLAADPHPQVAAAGRKALGALRRAWRK